jgi:hypothetical protein
MQLKFIEKIKTHFVFSNFFPKILPFIHLHIFSNFCCVEANFCFLLPNMIAVIRYVFVKTAPTLGQSYLTSDKRFTR